MGAKHKKKPNIGKLSRKQIRKEKRKEKKAKRNDYNLKRFSKNGDMKDSVQHFKTETNKSRVGSDTGVPGQKVTELLANKELNMEEQHKREQKQVKKLEKDMRKNRKILLVKENLKEDKTIKKLEKQLKLHKRKSKSIPKSFAADGLDYLLEVCNPEYISKAGAAENELDKVNEEFEEDFSLMTEHTNTSNHGRSKIFSNDNSLEDLSDLEIGNESSESDSEEESSTREIFQKDKKDTNILNTGKSLNIKRNKRQNKITAKKRKVETEIRNSDSDASDNNLELEAVENTPTDGTWEDIYGRLRSQDGGIVSTNEEKYVPPAIRARDEFSKSEDKKRSEKLNRLRKQLKGLLNRLAESNMHSISSQAEELYMNNSRNDMNDTLTSLILESVVSNILTPERLLMEHVLLVVVLHANVGAEVGAHFLQTVVKKLADLTQSSQEVEDKRLDNTVNVLSQLYNFKVFNCKLLFEILHRLAGNFEEKNVECILHVLRSVGFALRKDDPISLKDLILELQKQAATIVGGSVNNSRVKFLLEILMAIKNNNVAKIPNYDPSYSEHLKKIMKSFIRKGNYVTQLNISLGDLLKAEERGRWWIVGSAWTGTSDAPEKKDILQKSDSFSQKLLDLARRQRMNTDARRDIFCVVMSAEDYLDAFEKLLKLGLKNQQERDIIHVLLHCCLQEKTYNPYYAVLAQKFCDYDRKFQMTIKYSVWDKLKALDDHSGQQISNLAKLLIYLFLQKGLPISTLKIVEFGELDKITLRLIRQILLGILLHDNSEECRSVFEKVAYSDKLKVFRESLRLFIHHFLLKNLKAGTVPEDQRQLLHERVEMIEQILSVRDSKFSF
ncbi:nucleolar MIF4G domain-containing protein 1 [Cylas formicarius]|uniref:nucleolar MIF4G domain-containing protein 1 n=1 Tax=Cylas formicarius TaxID=197179 RepID=UPI00295893B4|nr:nucleolar MIF4G domain-containing protein 1 [Cylas formicarius]